MLGFYSRRAARLAPTTLYDELLEMAGDLKPRIIGIASSANVFAGNEIDRVQVQQFIGLLTRLTLRSGGGLVLISHPSLTGISSGTGLSGSTQWHNAVRARMVLTGDQKTGLRKLDFHKNQYGPVSESIPLCWDSGLFLPIGEASYVAKNQLEQAKTVFMLLLHRFRKQHRKVTANRAAGYAPGVFMDEPEAKEAKLTKQDLATAMSALMTDNQIQNVAPKKGRGHELIIVGEQEGLDV